MKRDSLQGSAYTPMYNPNILPLKKILNKNFMSGTVCVISSDLTYIRLLLQALQGTISKATFLFC